MRLNLKKHEILVFPASTVLLSAVAFSMAQSLSPVEIRISVQALLLALGFKDLFFGLSLTYIFLPERPERATLPDKPPIFMDGKPLGKIVPIATERIFPSEHVAVNLHKRDPRVREWATAVLYGKEPLTQKRWAGGKKKFSKPEYEAWIHLLLEKGVIVPKYSRGNNGGFVVNRASGREYLKSLADGREYLPLPQVDRSKSEHLWVRA